MLKNFIAEVLVHNLYNFYIGAVESIAWYYKYVCIIKTTLPRPINMAAKQQVLCDKPTELYRCVKLFEVEESSTVAGGETPLHAWSKICYVVVK